MSKYTVLDDDLHDYIVAHGPPADEVLSRVQEETAAMGEVAVMQVAADQAAFLTMLCRLLGASEALEIGTFTGYSAISIARGLAPGGRLIACELSEDYAEIAARNFEAAGVADRIEIRIGPAAETVAEIPERELFDFAFIDADKVGYPEYYELVLPRVRSGGLVMIDNVLAGGHIVSGYDDDGTVTSQIAAIRDTNDRVATDDRVDSVMLGIADGVLLARKR